MKKYLDLTEFKRLYNDFNDIPTWTKEKKARRDTLLKFFTKHQPIIINSHRDSKTTKVHGTWEYIIFDVSETQLGYLKPLRKKKILMICVGRDRFNHELWCMPIDRSLHPL